MAQGERNKTCFKLPSRSLLYAKVRHKNENPRKKVRKPCNSYDDRTPM